MGNQKNKVVVELITFNVIGLFNTIFCYILFVSLILMGLHYAVALIADYIVGATISFVLNKKYTFRYEGKTSILMILRMTQGVIFIFLINLFVLFLLVEKFLVMEIVAQLVSLAIVAIGSYLVQRKYVFPSDHA